MDMSGFDRYCDEHNISDDEAPAAFGAYLNEMTGWDGRMELMDWERIEATEETEQRFVEAWADEVPWARVSQADVGPGGEGEVEVVDETMEAEEWTDPGGTSDTTDTWWTRLRRWMDTNLSRS